MKSQMCAGQCAVKGKSKNLFLGFSSELIGAYLWFLKYSLILIKILQ